MMPTGSGTLCRPRASSPAFRVADPATSRSGTTSASTGAAAASRSCSAVSRTGAASPPATTGAQPSSSPPSPSPPLSSSGCDQRVLTLGPNSSSTRTTAVASRRVVNTRSSQRCSLITKIPHASPSSRSGRERTSNAIGVSMRLPTAKMASGRCLVSRETSLLCQIEAEVASTSIRLCCARSPPTWLSR